MTITADGLGAVASRLGAPLAEYLAGRIHVEAARFNRNYPRIPKADYEQVMWVYALEHTALFKSLLEQGKRWTVTRGLRRGAMLAIREDNRYVRARKALENGYSVEDEEFYSTGLLAKILPALLMADFDVSDAMQNASSGTDAAGIHIRSSDPFGGAENYQAMLIDISLAWKRLSEGQRRLLRAYYRVSQEDTADGRWERQQLASSMGLTEDALRQRAHRALRSLSGKLGGESPWV
jgi:hypothetical protein